MKIKHILVDIDPTKDSQPALTKAIALAKAYDASIELLLVAHEEGFLSQVFLGEEQRELARLHYMETKRKWLNVYLDLVDSVDVDVSYDVVWNKSICAGILEKVEKSNVDLVVKSTHRHPMINKALFTPTDWQLLTTCPVPLLLAKTGTAPSYKNILAAVDPMRQRNKPAELDQVILKTTEQLADKLTAAAKVIHCYEPVGLELWQDMGAGMHGFSFSNEQYKDYTQKLEKHHQDQFNNLLNDYHFSEDSRFLVEGVAHTQLVNTVAEKEVDLLVLGTTFKPGLLGTTSEKILDNIDCDLLAVKADEGI
ncbi:universal stress protein [Pleionea sp. CnH1-48]|uniref:universal stress protein n=1 Tax=Pleionea sp. CnH1-48 TaxID=2954494 RepID=UPI002097BF31|nr:universal stress protein [Pleionea sp. CnH1-48]MCO7223414.1 universal stress protein [Pleionea sp. CnH1-48]